MESPTYIINLYNNKKLSMVSFQRKNIRKARLKPSSFLKSLQFYWLPPTQLCSISSPRASQFQMAIFNICVFNLSNPLTTPISKNCLLSWT